MYCANIWGYFMSRYASIALAVAVILAVAPWAVATENGFGRYIPGVFAGPASEIVPPVPGFYWQHSTFYYTASTQKNLKIPLGRSISTELETDFFSTSFTGVWVPEWTPGKNFNVALGLTLPVQYLRVKGNLGRFSETDHSGGLGDILITPAIGWHEGPHLASLNLGIYLPTGPYDANALANIGMNYWTFTPSLAYAYINPEAHIDFSFVGGVDINTWNNSTEYRSGAMAHADATLLWTFDNGLGIGAFGGILYQISDDQGALAEELDGFKGRSFAIGPMIKYTGESQHDITATFNWAPEFGVKNRLEGNAWYLNLTARF